MRSFSEDDKKTTGSKDDFEKDRSFENPREAPPAPSGFNRDMDVEKQRIPNYGKIAQNGAKDPNLIEWDGPDDPGNPMNWSTGKKMAITMAMGAITCCVTFASSVFSAATGPTAQKFHVSPLVMVLATSLFVLGFSFGPLAFGPFSELYGRKTPLFIGFTIFIIFQIPVAVAQNIETIMLCRFFSGTFGSAPLAIVGGALADFWNPVDRGVAICVFASATFVGPILGPIVGGFITMSYLGWRWTAYITIIMASFLGICAYFIIPETYGPVILQQRAKKLRYETKNWAIHAKADETQINLQSIVVRYLLRPFSMLILEPILLLITIYMGLIYGIVYLFFEAYPIAFQEMRGWNLGVGSLPLLSISIGVILGGAVTSYITKTRFARILRETGQVVPEERLIPMIIGGLIFPAGMFWFAWTSSPHITWVPQVLAGIPIGMGVLMIFLQGLNYIIDVYKMNANSAVAANTFIRSGIGAGFPMFATAMYHNLGVPWASSLLGFLCAALFPVAVLFYIYGAKIRSLSKYSPT
ncbi:MFS general substrate transporter [Rhizodiscina lignyota]|uniref:MFS general substrate transporter n=1 Tax=Rhizodiscina lignyota TaxID=1504668 RepID=A0A9P4IIX4_9PEZI|nr:MFS general substrate transporter [Rhizodiscina lignyota]